MIGKNKKNQKKEKDIFKQSFDFEVSKSYLLEQSNKRAWFIAILACVGCLMSFAMLLVILPLKENTPYLVVLDQENSNVPPNVITVLENPQSIEIKEATDRFFVSQYVRKREQYYYETIQNDFNTIQAYSSPNVNEDYIKLFDEGNKNSRHLQLVNNFYEKTDIISIVLNHDVNNIATVRVKVNKIPKNKHIGASPTETIKVITLTYEYDFEALLTSEDRLNNPFGFIVTSYRVDEEYN